MQSIKKIFFSKTLPSHDEVFNLVLKTSELLENEFYDYREKSIEDIPGGLLDFSSQNRPLIVVPDIHARPDFIYNILSFKLPNRCLHKKISVWEALERNLINIVCVGDALHTEKTLHRWTLAWDEFNHGIYSGPAMTEEMQAGLNTICGLMKIKQLFPNNVHFLKGNHENIYNRTAHGDYSFRKYADEGNMVRQFLYEVYGDDVIFMLSCVENALPLVACTNNCVVSHAEPLTGFTRYQIVNARLYPEVIEGLTWTDNDKAQVGSVEAVIKNLKPDSKYEDFIYLGGHRPVPDVYLTRQNGKYVQFHNPLAQNIAFVSVDNPFNPETDFLNIGKNKDN